MTFFAGTDEIPLPEVEESLIDTQFIHWGYVNSCQRVVKGRKSKKEIWNTYWLELCGSTLRFFRDSSLHVESSLFPPPSTFIFAEHETKFAFFELENAEVHILSDEKFSQYSRKSTKKSICPQVYRRHLFEVKFRNLRSTYVFQAPSRSAMLRWVLKIQESLDAIKQYESSNLMEQHLNLAQDMIEKKSKVQKKFAVEELNDDESLYSGDTNETRNLNPALKKLKEQLAAKKDKIWQLEVQLIDFYGRGKGEFKRKEFVCTTNQDYFLVPGALETFIPCGTQVNVFGQLPNRRWRCVVEMKEFVKAIGTLIKDLKDGNIQDGKLDSVISERRNVDALVNLLNNLPDYPLLGCLPTSILNMKDGDDDEATSDNVEEDVEKPRKKSVRKTYSVTVTSSVKSKDDTTESAPPVKIEYTRPASEDVSSSSIVDPVVNSDSSRSNEVTPATDTINDDIIIIEDMKISDLDNLTPLHSESESTSEGEDEAHHIIDNVKLRNFGDGIIIRSKLRQKGISVIVGYSSSEDEEDVIEAD